METIMLTILMLIMIFIAAGVITAAILFLKAIHNALKVIPNISKELTKIRELLEKGAGKDKKQEGFTYREET